MSQFGARKTRNLVIAYEEQNVEAVSMSPIPCNNTFKIISYYNIDLLKTFTMILFIGYFPRLLLVLEIYGS